MVGKVDKRAMRLRRHLRVRKKVSGTPERPRLAVFRSEKHIYAQIIDDINAITMVSASSVEKEVKAEISKTWNKEGAKKVGELIAKRAIEAGIKEVIFDRGGFKFHGRIKELADGARSAGLKF